MGRGEDCEALVVVLEWLGASSSTVMATAEQRELGCCCGDEERLRQSKWRRGMARAGAGVMKARSGAAWPARTERWRRAAVAGDTRRADSETGRPFERRFSSSDTIGTA